MRENPREKNQQIVKRYFRRYTTLNPVVMHDLTEDQERLQEALDDKRLLLRYNYLLKQCQAWYDAPSGLYVIFNMPDHYNLAWVIWELKRRQRKKRELLEMYEKQLAANEKAFADKNEDLSRETAELYSDYKTGKVVTSAYTKEKGN